MPHASIPRIIVLLCGLRFAHSLSSTVSPRKPIKRVAIVGAGIAGLSLAHALKNSAGPSNGNDLDVEIYDSRDSLQYSVGSGVQLNGGMAVLGKINPSVQQAVMDAAVPIRTLKGRNKSWSREKAEDKLWDIDVEKLFKNAGGEATQEIIVGNTVMWFAIMRGALQKVLVETLPKDDSITMHLGKTLSGIEASEDGAALCQFLDGTTSGPFDMVIGCDGIKSGVKEYIEKGKISKDASKREGTAAALYSGIRVGFAVTDSKESSNLEEPRFVKQVFADGAYIFSGTFGNGKDNPPCECLFVTCLDDNYNGPLKRKDSLTASATSENADWTQDTRKPKQEARQQMIEQLAYNNIPGEDVAGIIEGADRFFELGVYFHNPLSLSGWSKKIPATDDCFAVLCGDSAHAMPPFLGQGANQAIQDAYLLAEKIAHYNEIQIASQQEEVLDSEVDFRSLLRDYERRRWGPTTSITGKAAILGYLETGGRNGFYSKFRDVFFGVLAFLGIPQRVLVDAATPKV